MAIVAISLDETFEIKWEEVKREIAQDIVMHLNEKFTTERFSFITFSEEDARIYATVTVDDCTPIKNMVEDMLREAELRYTVKHQK